MEDFACRAPALEFHPTKFVLEHLFVHCLRIELRFDPRHRDFRSREPACHEDVFTKHVCQLCFKMERRKLRYSSRNCCAACNVLSHLPLPSASASLNSCSAVMARPAALVVSSSFLSLVAYLKPMHSQWDSRFQAWTRPWSTVHLNWTHIALNSCSSSFTSSSPGGGNTVSGISISIHRPASASAAEAQR